MQNREPPRFDFIRTLCARLSEEEIASAEMRFARFLDILADIAADEATKTEVGTTDSTGTGVAP